jgi:hypothetical protein
MSEAKLPPHVIALVHHIELNKAGWWDRAVERLIIAALWLSNESLPVEAIVDRLRTAFSVGLDAAAVTKRIRALCESETLVALPNGTFKVAERSVRELEASIKECEGIARKVESRFAQVLKAHCPTLEAAKTWRLFNDGLLLPLIREMGARTYEFVSGTRGEFENPLTFQDFLERYPAELRQPVRNAVMAFLNPKDSDVRSYILRRLNAYFFVEAGNLSEGTVRALTAMRDGVPRFTLFADTNFLFSILGLHEDPSNEAAQLLMGVIRQVGDKVRVKLYVSPITVEEARGVLQASARDLAGMRLSGSLADAALEEGVSRLARKFAQESKRAGQPMGAEDYFRPYIQDLIAISRHRGVELYNREVESYKRKQEVIDNLKSAVDFGERSGRPKPKGHKAALHDMVLMQFVRDQRPVGLESPLDAEFWIVTEDLGLLRFDNHKARLAPAMVPVCLHPATLMQLLQFWIPRTRAFEEAVLDNLRLPFLFQEFDPATERVTLRILGALSRFEDIGDLPKEAITSIVVNDAVRQKLAAEHDVQRQIELVREAFVEEHERVRADLRAAEATIADLQRQAAESAETVGGVTRVAEERKRAAQELSRQLTEEREARESVEAQVANLEAELRTKEEEKKKRRRIRRVLLGWVAAPLGLTLLVAVAASIVIGNVTNWGFWRPGLGTMALLLILWVWVADLRGTADPFMNSWRVFAAFRRFKNGLFATLGVILLGLAANAIYEWIRGL